MDKLSEEILLVSGITSIFVITIFFIIIATGIIMLVLVYQKKQLQYIREKEQLKVNFEKEILATQIEIQEQTVQHISRELHDNLGQVASLIKINLNTIELGNIEKATIKIENTKNLTRQLISDLKALSVNLNGDRLSQSGLDSALEFEIDQLNKTGEYIASFSLPGVMPEISKDRAVVLYRMAQEIINNMVKHSGAHKINIVLEGSGNLIKLIFTDDGVGFDPQEQMNSGGAGLRNLQNRARLINALISIQSNYGTGTTITIELPL